MMGTSWLSSPMLKQLQEKWSKIWRWHEGRQGTSSLGEEAKSSHLLTKKLAWMIDREEPEEHTHARPPSPSPLVGSAVPCTPECPPSRSPSPARSTGKPYCRSLSQFSSSSSDSSESPQKPSHMYSESESEDNNETDSEASTDTGSDSGGKKNEGSASGGSQYEDSDSLTARLRTGSGSKRVRQQFKQLFRQLHQHQIR